MTACERCGSALDPTDAFCGVCGSFTAWSKSEAEAESESEQTPAGASDSTGVVGAVGNANPEAEVRPAAEAEPATVPRNPAAVQPGVPSIDRAPGRPAATEYAAAPDDVLCDACQASNPSARRFCRRCGARLFRHVVPARRGWWRRLLDRYAGWRRRRRLARKRGRLGFVLRLVAVLILCAGIGAGADYALHYRSSVTNTVQTHFAAPKPVNPRTATASSAAPGHPAGAALDGASDTWWSPAGGSGTGQWLQADFTGPHNLLDVDVMIGASQQQNAFLLQARPAELQLTATTASGRTLVQHLDLADKTGFQQFHVVLPATVSVRLTTESVYGAGPGRLTALAEVEFFADS